ncbi:hypothetical protein QQ054_34160 [Oscillatoria amoena NRMC-F 0135]|nr:hypothetical protein [Oscillatoria amoena NRMC-F 0135]
MRSRQSPRADHAHGSDATAEVKHGLRRGTPARAIPRAENVVSGEPVSIAELKEAIITADRVE